METILTQSPVTELDKVVVVGEKKYLGALSGQPRVQRYKPTNYW
ncbi:hypothetical protein [Desulfococcus sp.]